MKLALCIFLVLSNYLSSLDASSPLKPKQATSNQNTPASTRPRQQSLIAKSASTDSFDSLTSSESSISEEVEDDEDDDGFSLVVNKKNVKRSHSNDSDSSSVFSNRSFNSSKSSKSTGQATSKSSSSASSASDSDLRPIPGVNADLFALDPSNRLIMLHPKASSTLLDAQSPNRGLRFVRSDHVEALDLIQIALLGHVKNGSGDVDCWVPSQLHVELESARGRWTRSQATARKWHRELFNSRDFRDGAMAQQALEEKVRVYLKKYLSSTASVFHNPRGIPQCSVYLSENKSWKNRLLNDNICV